jgi:hypothetical protein
MTAESNPAEAGTEEKIPTPDQELHRGDAAELSEDQVLALLQRPEVTAETIVSLARNPSTAKSRKVTIALILHPRTPRHVSLPMLRRLFTFDLMRVALTPAVAADSKRAAEEQIMNRLESLSAGEKMSLARRASGRVAAALLGDPDPRIIARALDNSRLVEALVVAALTRNEASQSLFDLVSVHRNWAQRREVQIALLGSEKTPLERAMELARNFSADTLRQIVPESRQAEIVETI